MDIDLMSSSQIYSPKLLIVCKMNGFMSNKFIFDCIHEYYLCQNVAQKVAPKKRQ